MRILHLVASLDPRDGGIVEAIRQLADVSVRLGCTNEAATLDPPHSDFFSGFNFPVHGLGPGATHFRYSPHLNTWLLAHLAQFDVAVIHGLWQYQAFATRAAARRLNIPYVVYPHGMLDPYFKRAFPLKHAKKWLYWPWADYRVLRDAAAVLFTTEEERLLARQSFWLYSAREKVVNLGTARPTGQPGAQREAFYHRYPELRAKRIALFLSRLHPKKGCDLAIRAFAAAVPKNSEWQLVLAGPDQVGWQRDLVGLCDSLNVSNSVTFTGMLEGDGKWGAFHSAEFFFLPSHQENFAVVVAEALACGVPVFISDKINIWREVASSGCGLVAPDTLAGATSLLNNWLALSSASQNQMRARAIPCFEQHFEIERATANLIDVLRTIVPASAPQTLVL